MPPKKKGKKKEKHGSSKSKPPVTGCTGEQLSELSKEFYLIQIRDLEGQVARYQHRWDELQVKEGTFQSQLEQVSVDKREIVAFLKRTLDQRVDEITDLGEKMRELQEAKDTEKEAFEGQLAHARHEFQETKDQLTAENMLLAGKLAALEEFRVQKEELSAQFAALEEKLKKQEEDHQQLIYNLERKAVVDKDRLKKDTVHRVNVVAAEFRKVSGNQMAETTKRTIRENVSICAQLAKMSEKSMELIQENDHLKEMQTQQRRQIELLEHNEKELVKTNLSSQKVIRMLTEKCRHMEGLMEDALQNEHEVKRLEKAFRNLQGENKLHRERVIELEREVATHMAEEENMKSTLEREQNKMETVERILGQAAAALKDFLLEKPSDDEDTALDVTFDDRRNEMLQKFLALLNTAAELGLGPRLQEFLTEEKNFFEHRMSSKGERLNVSPEVKASRVISHYRIGDLGLVPRPDPSAANLSNMRLLSRTSQLGPLRGSASSRKSLIQVNSQEKEMRQPTVLPGIAPEAARHEPVQPESPSQHPVPPSPKQSVSQQPAPQQTVSQEFTPQQPASEEPHTQQPDSEEPNAPEPVSQEPNAPQPASEEPNAPEPASEEPNAPEPASEEPTLEQPVSQEPTPQEPVPQHSAPQKSVSQDPAPQESVDPTHE
ncbi:cilia- and flagella-associated protein 157 [Lissotriton helveticus]